MKEKPLRTENAPVKTIPRKEIEILKYHVDMIYEICGNYFTADPFINGLILSIIVAEQIGVTINPSTQGFDAWDKNNVPVELKDTNKLIGGSFQFHWLSENKLKKYSQCGKAIVTRRDKTIVKEAWEIPMSNIMVKLNEKANKKGTLNKGNAKNINAHYSFSTEKSILELGGIKIELNT